MPFYQHTIFPTKITNIIIIIVVQLILSGKKVQKDVRGGCGGWVKLKCIGGHHHLHHYHHHHHHHYRDYHYHLHHRFFSERLKRYFTLFMRLSESAHAGVRLQDDRFFQPSSTAGGKLSSSLSSNSWKKRKSPTELIHCKQHYPNS